MSELLVWWLVAEAVGLAAFPLVFVFFRGLPDRGFAFSKVFGLLVLGYAFWMGGVTGLLPTDRGAVALLLLVIAAVSWLVASGRREEMRRFIRGGWRYVLVVELMSALVLTSAVFLRSFVPEINSGEKPFELAFLNAAERAESFPPHDPWLAGENISYYYFGYVMIAALTKLAALDTAVTFFLGLSLIAALTWTAAFGLAYNLVLVSTGRGADEPPALALRPALFGLAAAFLMLIVSNFQGVFELMARHGVGSEEFYGLVGIFGLSGPYDCGAAPSDCAEWYPTRHLWWWWATRMGSNFDIQEFPFFSLHFGDLHPHVLVMPMLIALLAVAFQVVHVADAMPHPRRPLRFLLVALLAGGIVFTDAWAAPLTLLLFSAAALISEWRKSRSSSGVLRALAVLAPLAALAFVLYLPYYLELKAQTGGIGLTRVAENSRLPEASLATRPLHFFLFWGVLVWIAMSFVGLYLRRQRGALGHRGLWAGGAAFWALPVAAWGSVIIGTDGPGALWEEIQMRGANLLLLAGLCAAIATTAVASLDSLRRREDDAETFALALVVFSLVMLLGAELYFVKDLFGWRANTVFRFWHQAWILLALAGAFGLHRITVSWQFATWRLGGLPARFLAWWGIGFGVTYTAFVALDPSDTLAFRWWTAAPGLIVAGLSAVALAILATAGGQTRPAAARRLVWLAPTVVLLAASLTYPVLVTFDRTGGFANPQSLNGLDFVRRSEPLEYEAIRWLKDNVSGTPVILEATGADFSAAGRVSSRTGLPTVIGWAGHEIQWRGRPNVAEKDPFTARLERVDRIYNTRDVEEARQLMARYGVTYVFVGNLEREKYGAEGLLKFGSFMQIAFQNAGVTIYGLPEQPLTLGEGDG
jgi:YYY domain-containing protein